MPLKRAKEEFERHNLKEHIESGGQKDVFLGEFDEEDIVLKTLVVNSYEATKRAEREIKAMEIIESDVLVDLKQSFPTAIDGNEIFVMVEEYIPGRTLRDYIDQEGPGISLGIKVGKEILNVLQEFAEKDLVHRDIKPRNIMITPNGEVKLLDVGIVRMLNEEGLTPTFQDRGPGTWKYSAPEQLENQKEKQDTRTDLFSTGVVIFESMTGVHPFNTGDLPPHEAIAANERSTVSEELTHPHSEEFEISLSGFLARNMNQRFRKPEFALEEIQRLEAEVL